MPGARLAVLRFDIWQAMEAVAPTELAYEPLGLVGYELGSVWVGRAAVIYMHVLRDRDRRFKAHGGAGG